MHDQRIGTWQAFEDWSLQHDGWAFRGEKRASWPLLNSLARRLAFCGVPRAEWREREERGMRIFRRKAHVYLPDREALRDDLRCLAMMQHHGAPTRLLDFTKSPFVAAFFALESADEDATVYALDTTRLWDMAPRFDPSLTRDVIDPRMKENFARYFGVDRHPILWFGDPSDMDRRLVAQSGLLVMPGLLDTPLDVLLRSYDSDQPLMERVVLARELRREGMHALYRMNITQATLFPDLEGLARSIAYELEEMWPRAGSAGAP
jgi:hypothetical protein